MGTRLLFGASTSAGTSTATTQYTRYTRIYHSQQWRSWPHPRCPITVLARSVEDVNSILRVGGYWSINWACTRIRCISRTFERIRVLTRVFFKARINAIAYSTRMQASTILMYSVACALQFPHLCMNDTVQPTMILLYYFDSSASRHICLHVHFRQCMFASSCLQFIMLFSWRLLKLRNKLWNIAWTFTFSVK